MSVQALQCPLRFRTLQSCLCTLGSGNRRHGPGPGLILPIHLAREHTHGRLALLTFCLPVGLAAWALFQALIKPALTLLSGTGINGAALALVFTSALIRRRLLILGARRPLPDGS
jgi:hypothetical protein